MDVDRFERNGNYLKMTVKVDMEYIPAFEESVPMLLLEGNHMPLLLDKIKGELLEMEKQLETMDGKSQVKVM